MEREDIEITPGSWWLKTLPIYWNGQPLNNLSGYEFQLQVRSLADSSLLGQGTVVLGAGELELMISPTLFAMCGSGTSAVYAVRVRPVDRSWELNIYGGTIKKTGVDFSWAA